MGIKTSIARKVAMALSAFFLIIYLVQHLSINIISVFDKELFNEVSEFMGTNLLVQYILQPVLFFGIIFHFVMGFILEIRNQSSRKQGFVYSRPEANSTWMSRSMLFTGILILLFIGLHLVDFFFPTIEAHYIRHEEMDSYAMVAAKFSNPIYVIIYIIAFIFLSLHLLHGFQSAFQSVGLRHKKYTPAIKKTGTLYAVIIPLGFIYIAIHHYILSL